MIIAVCDNSMSDMEAICRLLSENGVETVRFTESESLLRSLPDIGCAAVIMDIELDNESGISAAAVIAREHPTLPVIFHTAYAEKYAQSIFLESIELSPFALIAKPPAEAVVQRVIEKLNSRISDAEPPPMLRFLSASNDVSLSCDEIMYIESSGHQLTIHCADGREHKVYEKLSHLFERLPEYFAFCHKSFVVNPDYVKQLTADSCELTDGSRLSVSRSRSKEFKLAVLLRRGASQGAGI